MAEVFTTAGYGTMAVVRIRYFWRRILVWRKGLRPLIIGAQTIQDIRSAKESTDVALDWWGKTEGPKFLFWHVMEPHMDLLPPQETRGGLSRTPLLMCPLVLTKLQNG